ncbi:hypothetical protein AAFF_G00304230 [Aldrovandia affinis]|uniref:Uncharacterized protein n=1 Tax=Aldrovandia affinis TaxID=143900 RepID=A0AAD7SQB6_9TELE|nr:hypothetical protein AAFF_G00304230 [Aldrovandia affinis]
MQRVRQGECARRQRALSYRGKEGSVRERKRKGEKQRGVRGLLRHSSRTVQVNGRRQRRALATLRQGGTDLSHNQEELTSRNALLQACFPESEESGLK